MFEKVKETGIYFIGTIGVAVISFIISLLYSNMFSTDDYGLYSLIAALYSLLYQLFTGWMTHSILRYYPQEKSNENAKSLRNTMLFILVAVLVLFSIIMLVGSFIYRTSPLLRQMCLVYIGVFFFEGLLLVFNTFLRAEGHSKQYSINIILNSTIKSVAIVVLYYVIRFKSVTVIIVSLLFAELIQSSYIFVKYKWGEIIDIKAVSKKLTKQVVRFGYPLIAVSIIFHILTYSDRYIIRLFQGTSEVGLYSYGYNMGNALFYTMTNAIMLGAYPRLTKEWVENGRKKTEEMMTGYLNMFCYLMIPATVGVIATGNRIIQTLCNQNYWDSGVVFIITCVSYAAFGFAQYTNKAWALTSNTKMILRLNSISAVLNIALNFLLIPKFGYVVAAITTLASFVVYILLSLFLSRKIFHFRCGKRNIVNIAISSVAMYAVLCFLENHLGRGLLTLAIEIMAGVVIYAMMLRVLQDKTMKTIMNTVVSKIRG